MNFLRRDRYADKFAFIAYIVLNIETHILGDRLNSVVRYSQIIEIR